MSITNSKLDQALQDRISSSSNVRTDVTSRRRIFNRVLLEMQLFANWGFSRQETTFDYDKDTEEYEVVADLGITDFKDVYSIKGSPVYDPRLFLFGLGKKIIGGKVILLMDLGTASETDVDFEYFSRYLVRDKDTNDLKLELETNDDYVDAPEELEPLILEWAVVEAFKNIKKIDKDVLNRAEDKLKQLKNEAFQNYGFSIKKGIKPINIFR